MGSIGNLNASGSGIQIKNAKTGYIDNYNGINSTMINSGAIKNANVSGNATTYSYGSMMNLNAKDNTTTINTGYLNNAKLNAGDNNTLKFYNMGYTQNLDADVFSRQNTGFINIQNTGTVINADLFDNVPSPPQVRRDLITYNNVGFTENLKAGTAGIGQVDINNWGNIWNLNASGNTHIWNG